MIALLLSPVPSAVRVVLYSLVLGSLDWAFVGIALRNPMLCRCSGLCTCEEAERGRGCDATGAPAARAFGARAPPPASNLAPPSAAGFE